MSKLYEEILSTINSKAVITNKGTGDVYAAKAIEKVVINAQIKENESILMMAERHMDERATMVLKHRISELQKQLEQ